MKPDANNPDARLPRSPSPARLPPEARAEAAEQAFLEILDVNQGPGVYVVLAPSGESRAQRMAHWTELAQARGHRVLTVNYTPQSRAPDLLALAGELPERGVVFVDLDDQLGWAVAESTGLADLDERIQQARRSLQSLNLARERLRRLPVPLFFWMSPEVLRAFALYAADLFAVRSGLLEVLEPPPEAPWTDLVQVALKTPWPSRYAHLPREELEGRLRLLQEALDAEARRPEPNLYRLARYHLDAADLLGSLGQDKRALHHAQQALELARKVNDPGLQADSWLAIGQWVAALGDDKKALQATQQAVNLYRDLARRHPDAFLPNLARSLGAHGYALLQAGQPARAAAAFYEGLEALLPFARALPQAYGELLGKLLRDYLEACRAAGQKPDEALVEQAADIPGRR